MDKITINCDIFLRQQHSSRLLPALYWPCFTRNIFLIQSLTHLLYPTMKNINISTKTQKKSSFYRRNNKIFQTICFAFANACAVRSTYSFLYVWHGLSQSLRFLPKDRRLGERDWHIIMTYVNDDAPPWIFNDAPPLRRPCAAPAPPLRRTCAAPALPCAALKIRPERYLLYYLRSLRLRCFSRFMDWICHRNFIAIWWKASEYRSQEAQTLKEREQLTEEVLTRKSCG
jgi:hypothetical protein